MPVGEQYRPAPFEQPNESAENITEVSQNTQKELGAKILTQVGFENRQKNIVNSSFDKARETKEKLLGKNNERRNYAYISRIENLVEKYGNKLEKKLWDASANKMIIQSNDIPESYWRTQEQILRDNGQGRELNNTEKEYLIEDIQKQQRESLRSWSDYLGDKNSPYPTWFKIYAWDGMSKMGVFDVDKKRYTKRDKTSVAPYPKLNPAALAKVHGAISDFYGIGDGKQRYAENEERDAELDALVKSGNFNRLYSKMMLDTKTIVKTPERTEDIKGEWIEYLPGQEEALAEAAEGTPWCVADPGTGRNYLEYGNSNGMEDDYDDDYYDDYDDDYYDDYDDDYKNRAKFILFHLNNPETNNLATNACASIRLDPDGNVAEISGLKEGQALEDSLVPIVEEKVKSLPGGEKFLEAFADKQELIKLDRKMQNGEDLTKEELEFVWEVNRPIKTLDTYNGSDPRIRELRSKFDIETCLEKGLDVNSLVPKTDPDYLERNFDALLSRGVDIDNLIPNVKRSFINDNFDMLLSRGADINNLVSYMAYDDVAENLDALINHGADINNIVSRMYGGDIAKNLDTLINHGADINNIVSHMYYDDIAKNLDTLLAHGADVNNLVSCMDDNDVAKNLDTLINHGADVNNLVSRMDHDDIAKNLDTLINHGAGINNIVSRMYDDDIANNLDTLINHGASIDIDELVSRMDYFGIAKNLDTLINHGADVNNIIPRMCVDDIAENLDTLINHGASIDIDELVSRMDYFGIANNLDTLINHGASIDIDELVSRMDYFDIAYNLDTLINHGVSIDIDDLVSHLNNGTIVKNLDSLIKHGADVNNIVSHMYHHDVAKNLDTLINHGASIDIDDLVSRLNYDYVAEDFDILFNHGADVNNIVSNMHSVDIAKNLDTLINHGADINNIVSHMYDDDIAKNLDTLKKYGYEP